MAGAFAFIFGMVGVSAALLVSEWVVSYLNRAVVVAGCRYMVRGRKCLVIETGIWNGWIDGPGVKDGAAWVKYQFDDDAERIWREDLISFSRVARPLVVVDHEVKR